MGCRNAWFMTSTSLLKSFPGFGHGDIINHPELLADELTRFVKN